MLAYWAMTLRMSFSTLGGMRPATLVMISWSSSRGSEGSLKVFIRVSTHFLSCNRRRARTRVSESNTPYGRYVSYRMAPGPPLTFLLKYGSSRQ